MTRLRTHNKRRARARDREVPPSTIAIPEWVIAYHKATAHLGEQLRAFGEAAGREFSSRFPDGFPKGGVFKGPIA